jgi:hypothetical protein
MKQSVSPSFAIFLAITLTSCSAAPVSNDVRTPTPPNLGKEISEGTGGALIDISSSNVSAAGYNAGTMIMTVQFNNGNTYEYYGVTGELWNSFIAAQPNPWSLVGYPRLVQAGVPYRRIR